MRGKETPPVLKLLVLALPIVAVVLVSGCTGGGSGIATGPGITILNWEPDYSSVESGDDVQLRLQIQNQGGERAENVRALLTVLTFGGNEWLLRGTSGSPEVMLEDYMLPPNPRYGTEGEKKDYIWYLTAPQLPEGLTQTYTPGVRVFYDYVTTATKPITIVNDNELRHLEDTGGSLPSQPSQYSGGPLAVTVTTGAHIKVGDYGHSFPITIHIENTGGGIPYWGAQQSMLYGISEDEEYMVRLGIQLPPGVIFETCQEYSGTVGQAVQLWKGRSADISCKLAIPSPPPVAQEGTVTLFVYYSYAIDRSTSITVKGIR